MHDHYFDPSDVEDEDDENGYNPTRGEDDGKVYEMAKILAICFYNPKKKKKSIKLVFQVV